MGNLNVSVLCCCALTHRDWIQQRMVSAPRPDINASFILKFIKAKL